MDSLALQNNKKLLEQLTESKDLKSNINVLKNLASPTNSKKMTKIQSGAPIGQNSRMNEIGKMLIMMSGAA